MIKKLAKSIREYKKVTILTPVLVTLEVVMEVLIPLIMAKIIDIGIMNENSSEGMHNIIVYGLLLLGAAIFSMMFGAFAGVTAAKASCGFAKNLRQDMFYNVQNFSFSNIDKFSTSSIITRLTTDVTNVQMSFQMLTRMAFRSPVMLVFALFSSFTISVKLSTTLQAQKCLLTFLSMIQLRVHTVVSTAKIFTQLNSTRVKAKITTS